MYFFVYQSIYCIYYVYIGVAQEHLCGMTYGPLGILVIVTNNYVYNHDRYSRVTHSV